MNAHKYLVVFATVLTSIAAGEALHLQVDPPSMQEMLEQSKPGPAHARLGRLSGKWDVEMRMATEGVEISKGAGQASAILDGRFQVIDFTLDNGPGAGSYRYTLGFDRRHDEYSIVVMDTNGTYFVTARGPEADGIIPMAGSDDDPMMARMGFEKKFVFALDLPDDDTFSVSVFYIDTRTAEAKRIPYGKYVFNRHAG